MSKLGEEVRWKFRRFDCAGAGAGVTKRRETPSGEGANYKGGRSGGEVVLLDGFLQLRLSPFRAVCDDEEADSVLCERKREEVSSPVGSVEHNFATTNRHVTLIAVTARDKGHRVLFTTLQNTSFRIKVAPLLQQHTHQHPPLHIPPTQPPKTPTNPSLGIGIGIGISISKRHPSIYEPQQQDASRLVALSAGHNQEMAPTRKDRKRKADDDARAQAQAQAQQDDAHVPSPQQPPPAKRRRTAITAPAQQDIEDPSDGDSSSDEDEESDEEEKDVDETKCENFKNCGEVLVRGTSRAGPHGRLCNPCGKRFERSKGGEGWRTSGRNGGLDEESEEEETCENFGNCGAVLNGQRTRPGPDGSKLCEPCGDRLRRSTGGDKWRTSGQKKVEEGEKCENFKNCGTVFGRGSRTNRTAPGPDGSRLCVPCGDRFKRSKGGDKWRTSAQGPKKPKSMPAEASVSGVGGIDEKGDEDSGEEGEGEKCENFKNCGARFIRGSRTSRPGPDGSRLCVPCGDRFRRSKEGKDWDWRTSGQGPKKPKSMPAEASISGAGGIDEESDVDSKEEGEGKKCENFKNCGTVFSRAPGSRTKTRPGPKGSRLCNPCGTRFERSKGGEGWRNVPTGNRKGPIPRQWSHTCTGCGRHNGDFSDEELCESCSHRRHVGAPDRETPNSRLHHQLPISSSAIRDLAHSQFRQLYPIDPFVSAKPRPKLGPNYWHEGTDNLREVALQRGIVHKGIDKTAVITLLQLDDAWDAELPRANPANASYLHTLSSPELIGLASGAGFRREMGQDADLNANTALAFLLSKRDATDHVKPIKDKAAWIREAVTNVFGASNTKPAPPPTHQSHNAGIVGTERALSRLFITLANGHLPAWTPSDGFQCGPIALARTLQAVREQYNSTGGDVPLVHPTQQDLRALLFVDWDNSARVGAMGQPTAAYTQYLARYLAELPAELQEDERRQMLQLVNMDIQQLIAMVVLLRDAGQVDDDFNVGVVTDARGGAPANAQIVRETEDETGAPTLWLHHNHAAGGAHYHHWEGFEPQREETDYNIVYEWGLAADPTSNDIARTRWSSGSAPGRGEGGAAGETMPKLANESRIAYLTRLARNATKNLNAEIDANGRACKPCRKKNCAIRCKRSRGHRYCDPCQEDDEIDEMADCVWPEGSAEAARPTWKTANTLTDEDMKPWERPLAAGTEQQMMEATQKYILGEIPNRRHFLCIPTGRQSSHQGALAMAQLIQSLIMTVHAYNNLLNDPNVNAKEGQRPGAQNMYMRTHILAFARHGAAKIPTHHGNLQNDALHLFLNLIDQILDPNNVHLLPIEIHFLLLGIAGFAVDITAWGDRTEGLFRRFLDTDVVNAANGNPTNIAGSVYLIPVSELHVHAQGSPSSINGNNPPHGIQRNNKRLVKYRLEALIDRRTQLMAHAATLNNGLVQGMPFNQYMQNMLLLHTGNPVQPVFQAAFANPPQWPAGMPEVEELDRMIMAMYWEMAWRSAWLDANTTPTEPHVRYNNDDRNDPMM
ncbi:hypothetical protein LTR17_012816 [Elasticomyces elasticus]|nr:hypothetical protein LTR17_012816 [Elasticomyces elasticus]